VLRRLYQTSHQVGTFQALGFERMMCPGAHRIETAVVLTLGEVKGDAPLLRIHPSASLVMCWVRYAATVAIS